jgi:hypothetical protein
MIWGSRSASTQLGGPIGLSATGGGQAGMTMKRRMERLERKTPAFYTDISEVPTHELERLIRKAFREGNFTEEEAELYRKLEDRGLISNAEMAASSDKY